MSTDPRVSSRASTLLTMKQKEEHSGEASPDRNRVHTLSVDQDEKWNLKLMT